MEYHEENGLEGHAMCVDDMAGIRAAIERLIAEPRLVSADAGAAAQIGQQRSKQGIRP